MFSILCILCSIQFTIYDVLELESVGRVCPRCRPSTSKITKPKRRLSLKKIPGSDFITEERFASSTVPLQRAFKRQQSTSNKVNVVSDYKIVATVPTAKNDLKLFAADLAVSDYVNLCSVAPPQDNDSTLNEVSGIAAVKKCVEEVVNNLHYSPISEADEDPSLTQLLDILEPMQEYDASIPCGQQQRDHEQSMALEQPFAVFQQYTQVQLPGESSPTDNYHEQETMTVEHQDTPAVHNEPLGGGEVDTPRSPSLFGEGEVDVATPPREHFMREINEQLDVHTRLLERRLANDRERELLDRQIVQVCELITWLSKQRRLHE
jgi:hypothetical protein